MKPWVGIGLIWGFCMFIGEAFLWPLIDDKEIILKTVLLKFLFWMFFGLIFGYAFIKIRKKKK
ncbi:hypothetical protein [Polaribacter staleyi]|uniref:hypothetical protein n=1 Tax=Polaribacter staleyi TaxID=2022337 RepID=UPI0031BB8242